MKKLFITVILVLLYHEYVCTQLSNCLRYEPAVVTLTGVIERQIFPGRPNYKSIKNGDEPETCWILKLQRSVCVAASDTDQVNETEYNVKRMHLVLQQHQYKSYHKLLGRKVIVTGTLFHSITGHHHTRVLLTTKEIKEQ
ncbi:MAG: DUF4431 domain-containing protein [Ignavibacteriales bacterium]|nr:DUF4431 domain-containing protein [Ignavibacteriales bacterium]